MKGLEWGLTEWAARGGFKAEQRKVRIRNSRDDIRMAVKSLTVNGVPLADVLDRAAFRLLAHPVEPPTLDEAGGTAKDAAVLRALAGSGNR